MPTDMEEYLFDLNGYIVIKQALSQSEVAALNAKLDELFAEQEPSDPALKNRKGYEAFGPGGSLDTVEGAVEVLMIAGDVLLFVDCLAHGSWKRRNPGLRRSVLYRYGPRWDTYRPPEDLLPRLTRERQALMNVKT